MWRIINKELGSNPGKKGSEKGNKMWDMEMVYVKDTAEMYSSYFTEIIGKLAKQNNGSQAPQAINSCNETMFIYPVTEIEIAGTVHNLGQIFSRH
jgi:hypothetical protein